MIQISIRLAHNVASTLQHHQCKRLNIATKCHTAYSECMEGEKLLIDQFSEENPP